MLCGFNIYWFINYTKSQSRKSLRGQYTKEIVLHWKQQLATTRPQSKLGINLPNLVNFWCLCIWKILALFVLVHFVFCLVIDTAGVSSSYQYSYKIILIGLQPCLYKRKTMLYLWSILTRDPFPNGVFHLIFSTKK